MQLPTRTFQLLLQKMLEKSKRDVQEGINNDGSHGCLIFVMYRKHELQRSHEHHLREIRLVTLSLAAFVRGHPPW